MILFTGPPASSQDRCLISHIFTSFGFPHLKFSSRVFLRLGSNRWPSFPRKITALWAFHHWATPPVRFPQTRFRESRLFFSGRWFEESKGFRSGPHPISNTWQPNNFNDNYYFGTWWSKYIQDNFLCPLLYPWGWRKVEGSYVAFCTTRHGIYQLAEGRNLRSWWRRVVRQLSLVAYTEMCSHHKLLVSLPATVPRYAHMLKILKVQSMNKLCFIRRSSFFKVVRFWEIWPRVCSFASSFAALVVCIVSVYRRTIETLT